MPTLDFTGATFYSQIIINDVGYTSTVSSGATVFRWFVESGADNDTLIEATGTGFSFDGSGFPTGGTVNSISIDSPNFDGMQPFNPQIFITGLNVALSDLITTGSQVDQTDAFWGTIQAGNDTILTSTEGGWFFGDFLNVSGSEDLLGGDDTITANQIGGSSIAGYVLQGDANQIFSGGRLTGGNDVIDINVPLGSITASGDVWGLFDGEVIGGDDTITVAASTGESSLSGDAGFITASSTLVGGDDSITGSDSTGDLIFGETRDQPGGSVTGGNDRLFGRGGDDTLFGDIDEMSGGTLIGGDDLLMGGAGNDLLFGDLGSLSGGTAAGGQDTLLGGTGNDTLRGGFDNDLLFGGTGLDLLFGGLGNDILRGGGLRDVMYGEQGNDLLFGENGFDALFGSIGNDTLAGGNQADVLVGGDGNDALFGENGNDRLFGDAGFDQLFGGNGNDTLSGGIQADLLVGGGGNDVLFANQGHDTLNGGAGNDFLNGGLHNDTFIFGGVFGDDTIAGFEANNNLEDIDLSGVAVIVNFADLQANYMIQVGADVVIDDGLGNTITVLNVGIGDMNEADFVF